MEIVILDGIENIVKPETQENQFFAMMDRSPVCYKNGEAEYIKIHAKKNEYLYILNIAADASVTILYPNQLQKERPVQNVQIEFPSQQFRQSNELEMRFNAYSTQGNYETIKLISSPQKIDFSFLPVPVNQVFTGVSAGDLKKVLQTLQQASGWTQFKLKYWVGETCQW